METVLGVLLLKEIFGLTDMEALEQLEFNLLWHHALALSAEEAHLCQKHAAQLPGRHRGDQLGVEARPETE